MWNALLPAITTLAGTWISADANRRAAEDAMKAQRRAAEIEAAAIREGNQQAQQTLEQIRGDAAPATSYLRRLVADPGALTPLQQQQLDQARSTTANQLRGSPFGGSGRTATAMFRDVESNFVNQALEHNRNRAFDAARALHGPSTQAATSIAGLQSSTGRETGRVEGGAVRDAGLTSAQSTLATGNLMGQAIGDLGSAIAAQQRESRYRNNYGGLYRI